MSRWFGEIESTFYKHPRSPHPDIFRVSNDEAEGCRNVGRSGWHIDGSFQTMPFQIQTMHFWSVSQSGSTLFSPLHELVESLPSAQRAEWDKLSFVGRGRQHVVHPLVYRHPTTNQTTLCFHCGEPFVEAFVSGYQPPDKADKAMHAVLTNIIHTSRPLLSPADSGSGGLFLGGDTRHAARAHCWVRGPCTHVRAQMGAGVTCLSSWLASVLCPPRGAAGT